MTLDHRWPERQGRGLYKRILVVNDGSQGARRASGVALGLATLFGAQLHMIMVEEVPRFALTIGEVDEQKAVLERRFAFLALEAAHRAAKAGVAFRSHIVMGRLFGRVLECIEDNRIDLLVLGALQRSPVSEFILGSTVERLVRSAPCASHLVK